MLSPKLELIATLDALSKAVDSAKAAVNRESFDLSHQGCADRIHLVETLANPITKTACEALHGLNMMAIGHTLVDEDYASIMEDKLLELQAEEYDPAFTRQAELAEEARRERRAA
ncbi:hypothetical protein [Aureimonas psammosilenae]|uniref:hypothetical protein n=1 Tax=Aureimonas psammosilenae TaxID=2495496 RepID=UPI001260D861|nr:hypothetical protein [Aureimonas psammosilenae]